MKCAPTGNCCSVTPPKPFRLRSVIFFFDAMTVVEQILPATEIGVRYDGYRRETLTLTWEERRQGHGRRHTDAGLEFAISLPGGTILKEGDCMILEPEQAIVRVREAPEPVYVVRPGTPHDWAYYA